MVGLPQGLEWTLDKTFQTGAGDATLFGWWKLGPELQGLPRAGDELRLKALPWPYQRRA